MITARDIKTGKLSGHIKGTDSPWKSIKFPNGNVLHNVKRSGNGGILHYESDRFSFGYNMRTMADVKNHAAEYWNRNVAK